MSEDQGDPLQSPSDETAPVLVAVDFTPDSEAAVVWGSDFAQKVGVPLQVLHVVHDPGEAPGSYRSEDKDALRPMVDVAAEMMSRFLDKLSAEHPELPIIAKAQPVLITGIPATRILEVAEQNGARMIVMGSRGRTGLPHLLLGSKAQRVVQLSPIPVTIVKARASDD